MIGNRSDVENVSIERLQSFYHRYYRPDNAVLIVAGKIDPARTLGLVAQQFGPIPKPQQPLDTQYTTEPVQDGERAFTVRRLGGSQSIAVGYHTVSAQHSDAPALEVLAVFWGLRRTAVCTGVWLKPARQPLSAWSKKTAMTPAKLLPQSGCVTRTMPRRCVTR